MWSPLTLAPPSSNSSALGAGLTVLAVDPWTPGIASGIGSQTNLSFPNAVSALVDQLTGLNGAGLAIAHAATSAAGLAAELETFANAFPMPNFERLARRAAKMAELQATKMNLVPPMRPSLGLSIDSMPAIRALKRADLIKAAFDAAESFKTSNANSNLTTFAGTVSSYAGTMATLQAEAAAGLTGGNGWRFYAANNVASALKNGHPGHDKAYTSIMLFLGSVADLAILTEIFPPP